ncbi:antibiotic biosynthesis monooxygenase family protein [Micromonospora wenchangensis]|nr:antibiotic biosynthesis monooxygenase family protein [Micromonospora wenchangensis]
MVMFITKFTVKGEPEQFEKFFAEHAGFMSSQPGFVSFQLVRAAGDPHSYLNIGQWQTVEDQRRVTQSAEFRSHAATMRELVDVEAGVYLPVASAGQPL